MDIKPEDRIDATQRDSREMTDEEVMKWMQDLITRLMDEKGTAGNACNFEAVKPPIRRNILHALAERALQIDEVSERVGIAGMTLRYHLNVLTSGYFIRVEGSQVDLTPGGVSVVRSDRRRSQGEGNGR